MIRNIIFDIGKVLIGFDWKKYIGSMFDEETADKVSHAMFGSGHWPELDRAVLAEDEILELFYGEGPDVKAEIRQAYDGIGKCVERCDWVIPLIDSLAGQGYRVFFLSNMSQHVINSNPEAFDFVRHMDGGIFSCNVHVIKPDPEIYSRLIRMYDLVPEECLFIDDHYENVAAARRLGMKGLAFRSAEQMKTDLAQALLKDRTHDKITVLCYGDSNTYGFNPLNEGRYPAGQRWTSILAESLGPRYEVIAEGLNGRTTAYDRPGAGWKNGVQSFIACLGTHKPIDYLVIMLGTNDCIAALDIDAETIAGGMDTLVRLAIEKSPEIQGYIPEIIVVSPPPLGDECAMGPFAWEFNEASVAKSKDLASCYRKLAADRLVRFLDAAPAEVSDADFVHLSAQGHRDMAELVRRAILHPVLDVQSDLPVSRP